MTDIIDQIDAATGCQHCQGALGDSVSPDFCSPHCQAAWHAAHTQPLTGYREPTDLAAHVNNLVEQQSPETTPDAWQVEALYRYLRARHSDARRRGGAIRMRAAPRQAIASSRVDELAGVWVDEAEAWVRAHEVAAEDSAAPGDPEIPQGWQSIGYIADAEPVAFGFDAGVVTAVRSWNGHVHIERVIPAEHIRFNREYLNRMVQDLRTQGMAMSRGLAAAARSAGAAMRTLTDNLPAAPERPSCPMQQAIEARQNRNTGPSAARRAPRRIDPRRNR